MKLSLRSLKSFLFAADTDIEGTLHIHVSNLCGRAVYQKSYVHWLTRVHCEGRNNMVYCTKCGTNNAEGATVCVQCRTPLYGTSGEGRLYWRYEWYEREYGFHRRSGAIAGIVIGLIIIFVGFSLLVAELYDINIPWGPIIIILFGVFILVRLFQGRRRRL
jgi:hypothetical protein